MRGYGKAAWLVGTVLTWLIPSDHARATDIYPMGIICTAEPNFPGQPWTPPPVTETGLGDDVDKLAYVPNRLHSGVKSLKSKGWAFEYGSSGFADRTAKKIQVQRAGSALTHTAGLSHEVGHAKFNPKWDYSSKEAYLAVACLDEGHGIYENYVARDVILNYCPGELDRTVDIGLAATLPWNPYITLIEGWREKLQPVDLAQLGMLFCRNNVTSTTGEPYLDYYGNWYDEHYGNASVTQNVNTSETHLVPEATIRFLVKIDQLAEAAASGMEKLAVAWPATNLIMKSGVTTSRSELSGGHYQLDAHVAVTSSMIVPDGRNVNLASMSIEGICVTRQDIEQYYPDLVLFDIPRPGMPNSPATWAAYGSWGVKLFTFHDRNPCLVKVTFQPTPTMPQAFPGDIRPDLPSNQQSDRQSSKHA